MGRRDAYIWRERKGLKAVLYPIGTRPYHTNYHETTNTPIFDTQSFRYHLSIPLTSCLLLCLRPPCTLYTMQKRYITLPSFIVYVTGLIDRTRLTLLIS
jgi:hypothetical protein